MNPSSLQHSSVQRVDPKARTREDYARSRQDEAAAGLWVGGFSRRRSEQACRLAGVRWADRCQSDRGHLKAGQWGDIIITTPRQDRRSLKSVKTFLTHAGAEIDRLETDRQMRREKQTQIHQSRDAWIIAAFHQNETQMSFHSEHTDEQRESISWSSSSFSSFFSLEFSISKSSIFHRNTFTVDI